MKLGKGTALKATIFPRTLMQKIIEGFVSLEQVYLSPQSRREGRLLLVTKVVQADKYSGKLMLYFRYSRCEFLSCHKRTRSKMPQKKQIGGGSQSHMEQTDHREIHCTGDMSRLHPTRRKFFGTLYP